MAASDAEQDSVSVWMPSPIRHSGRLSYNAAILEDDSGSFGSTATPERGTELSPGRRRSARSREFSFTSHKLRTGSSYSRRPSSSAHVSQSRMETLDKSSTDIVTPRALSFVSQTHGHSADRELAPDSQSSDSGKTELSSDEESTHVAPSFYKTKVKTDSKSFRSHSSALKRAGSRSGTFSRLLSRFQRTEANLISSSFSDSDDRDVGHSNRRRITLGRLGTMQNVQSSANTAVAEFKSFPTVTSPEKRFPLIHASSPSEGGTSRGRTARSAVESFLSKWALVYSYNSEKSTSSFFGTCLSLLRTERSATLNCCAAWRIPCSRNRVPE